MITSIETREETVTQIRQHHRYRRFAMKTQQRSDRSLESFIRINATQWRPDLDPKDREKINAEVKALIKSVRDGKSEAFRDAIEMSDRARAPADELREKNEKKMKDLAKTLPVWPWAEGIDGFGELGLATIVAEAGDLSKYTVGKLWKRLGYAPYGDPGKELAGSTWKREKWRYRALTADEWKAAPFSGERYALIFTISEWLVNRQWIGKSKTDDGVGKPNGPYGEIYHARRQRTAVTHPDWTDAHARKDALRITMKTLLKNLWAEWTRLDKVDAEPAMPERRATTLVKPKRRLPAEPATATGRMKSSKGVRSQRPATSRLKSRETVPGDNSRVSK